MDLLHMLSVADTWSPPAMPAEPPAELRAAGTLGEKHLLPSALHEPACPFYATLKLSGLFVFPYHCLSRPAQPAFSVQGSCACPQ